VLALVTAGEHPDVGNPHRGVSRILPEERIAQLRRRSRLADKDLCAFLVQDVRGGPSADAEPDHDRPLALERAAHVVPPLARKSA
jgi:hypothetical protein